MKKRLISFDARKLQNALNSVNYCADTESSRFALGAVLLESCADVQNSWHVVASDGRRLASTFIESLADSQKKEPLLLLIPIATAREVARKISGAASRVSLEFVGAKGIGWRFCWKARKAFDIGFDSIAGRFPNWRQVIPDLESAKGTADINCASWFESLDFDFRAVDIFVNSKAKWRLPKSNGELQADTIVRGNLGNSRMKNRPLNHTGVDFDLMLDRHYLMDFLSAHSGQTATAHYWDCERPIVFAVGNTRSVLMPMSRER